MDRKIVYPGSIPLETDLLRTNKYAMFGVGLLAESLLGTGTQYSGLDVHPTTVPSMAVSVHRGIIYKQVAADASAYSSLSADPTPLVKQGALLTPVSLSMVAPTTVGYAVNYLIQVTLDEVDSDAAVLPYYNASNPSQAFAGPGNNGLAQPTSRKAVATVSALAGAAAPAGTQTTPSPTSGHVGVAVVTVNYGDTTIGSGAIADYPGTPRIAGSGSFAPIDSPHFTGVPTVPTVLAGDDSTKAANTHFVHDAVATATAGLASTGYVAAQIAAGHDASLTTNGYQKLPNGFIMQWGLYTGSTDTSTITFPIPFPNACFSVQVTARSSYSDSTQNANAYSITTTNFIIRAQGNERPTMWFAIGF